MGHLSIWDDGDEREREGLGGGRESEGGRGGRVRDATRHDPPPPSRGTHAPHNNDIITDCTALDCAGGVASVGSVGTSEGGRAM